MYIHLGKKKPTSIEEALLEKAGLGKIKGNFITGYYLEPPAGLNIEELNGTIQLNGEPIILQQLNDNRTVRGFTLDIDGLFRTIDPTWNESSKVEARKENFKNESIDARVAIYKKFENALSEMARSEKEFYVAQGHATGENQYIYLDKAIKRLQSAIYEIESIAEQHPDICEQYLTGREYYHPILRGSAPGFYTI